ncbi:MAG: outer membrane lipoprotein carrier protein LolA [Prevotellaceae bacterium]|jgi:outer membrane lipoprotein-sorting protein|nr:outer membrane lipoprotein carrier protein LolA [Prevotellaceae bacterium]
MKKMICWAALCLISAWGYAQPARDVVQRFLEKMTSGPVEMMFKFTYENTPKKIRDMQTGIMVYSGEHYHLQLGDLDIYCDGVSKWIYNEAVNEVTIFPSEEAVEMTDNPLKYILNNENKFRYRPVKHLAPNGKKVFSTDLIPTSKDAAYTMINLQVEEETFLPVQLTYKLKNGQRYILDVDSLNTEVAVKAFSFSFPAHRYPNAVVNDLR